MHYLQDCVTGAKCSSLLLYNEKWPQQKHDYSNTEIAWFKNMDFVNKISKTI